MQHITKFSGNLVVISLENMESSIGDMWSSQGEEELFGTERLDKEELFGI